MRVTIVLDTGAFFPTEKKDQTYFDVGYFQTTLPSDIEVSEDTKVVQASPAIKLGKGNQRIEVEHVEKDKVTVKHAVNPLASFTKNILRKDDLYSRDYPKFIDTAYDCILRFNSGAFTGEDVKKRRFTEIGLSDDLPTGKDKWTRDVANEIHVTYNLGDGETLRLRRQDGSDVWTSSWIVSGAADVVVKILADENLNKAYLKTALGHKVQHYYLPNSDPPPMNGP